MRKLLSKTLQIRQLTGMSQQETAAMLGISREALALHETGKRLNLPGSATVFHGLLLAEMNKPENKAPATVAPSETAKEKLKQQLTHIIDARRYELQQVQRCINKCRLKQMQQQNRLRVVPSVEKVQSQLLAQSNGPWQPVSQRQQQWLKMVKEFHSFTRANEGSYIEQQLLQLRYNMLVMEAAEAEKMLAELDDPTS